MESLIPSSPNPIDRYIKLMGLTALFLLIGLPIFYYGELPDTIPIHFGANGEPDGYSSKMTIWLLPIIGLILYLVMTQSAKRLPNMYEKYPNLIHSPVQITAENKERQLNLLNRFIYLLNTFITIIFAYIIYVMIKSALGTPSELGKLFLPLMLIGTFGIIAWYWYQAKTMK